MSKKKINAVNEKIELNIPDDEVWTYKIEGLAAPHVNKPYKYYNFKKFIFAITIIIAVSLSCYFSLRTVQSDVFEYKKAENGYEFSKFSNTGFITEIDIDYVSELVYDESNPDPYTNFSFKKDTSKIITEVREFTLNCDDKVKVINISKDVLSIDGKAFYSCWALQKIEVDEENPNYCDVDGVLYNKDKTKIIFRPCDHDTYLAEKYGHAKYDDNGFRIEPVQEDENYEQYVKDVLTYVVPSSVDTIGELCFNYANMKAVYLPEGLKTIETLGFFEIPALAEVYSYKSDKVEDPHYTDDAALGEVYISLPEGLEYIGSDAFSYNQAMTYVYIPASVIHIGHHAFWDTVYIDKHDNDTLKGITAINVAADKETFSDVEKGDSWRPQYDYMLFKKSIDINYSAERMNVK